MKKQPYEITSEQVGEWLDKNAGTRNGSSGPSELQLRNAYALGSSQAIIAALLRGDNGAREYYRKRFKE